MRKKGFAVILIVFLAFLLGFESGYANSTQNVYLDDLASTSTYVINGDGTGNYWAVRYDGKQFWTSTNASYVVNTAITTASAGSKISFRTGIYNFTAWIRITKAITLMGEAFGGVTFRAVGITLLISIGSSSSMTANVVLENLLLDSNNIASSVSVEVQNVKDSLFKNLILKRYRLHGFKINGTDTDLALFTFWNNWNGIYSYDTNSATGALFYIQQDVSDNMISYVRGGVEAGYGFHLLASGPLFVSNVHLSASTFLYAVTDNGDINKVFMRDVIADGPTLSHIFYFKLTSGSIYDCSFKDVILNDVQAGCDMARFEGAAGKQFAGIAFENWQSLETNHRYIASWNNVGTFTAISFFRFVVLAGVTGAYTNITSSMIQDDYVFINKKSDTATVVAGNTNVNVTHGLSVTPTLARIRLTPQDDLGGRSLYVSNAGASTFRITMSSVDSGAGHVIGWSYED